MFDNLITAMPHVKSRQAQAPRRGRRQARRGVSPTCRRSRERLPGFRSETWMGISPLGHRAPEIAAQLSAAEVARAVQRADFKRFITGLQAEVVGNYAARDGRGDSAGHRALGAK